MLAAWARDSVQPAQRWVPMHAGCGEECSTDGIHSYEFVYDTALQHILNIWKQWSTELKAAEEARP